MKSVICIRPHVLEATQAPKIKGLAEGWVLLDVAYVGICGTDYHIFEGKHPFLEYPRIIGHELSGTVVDANGVSDFSIGDKVVINPYLSCGTCKACREGKPNCCEVIQVLGVHRDGGLCEQLAVPAKNLIRANSLTLRDAAMVEFLAIGAHAVRRAGRVHGNALVVGAGPIGLGVAIFAGTAGLDVTVLDVSAERIAQSQTVLGDVHGIVAEAANPSAAVLASHPSGFDVVFDATGNSASIMKGFQYVAHGGTYVLVSVVKDDITFSDPEFHKREMSLIGSRNATDEDFEHVMTSIAKGLVPMDQLATHECSLDTVAMRLPEWASDKSGLIKALVKV